MPQNKPFQLIIGSAVPASSISSVKGGLFDMWFLLSTGKDVQHIDASGGNGG